jgi:AraC-like DNA-binding protein
MDVNITITPSLSFVGILNFLGAAQGILLSAALIGSKDGNKIANRLLAALTIAISIIVSGAVLISSNYVFIYPHFSRIHHPFAFLAGPLLFLYLRELTVDARRFDRRNFLHFIPFALCLVYLLPYYFQSHGAKIKILSSEYVQASFGQWYYIRSAAFIVQFLVYLILVVLTLIQYSRRVKRHELLRNELVITELRFFVGASSVLWLGAVLRYTLDSSGVANLLLPLGASIVIYGMGYLRMRRPKPAASQRVVKEALAEEPQPVAKKYEKSTLTRDRAERYRNKLLEYMQEAKPFTDGDLNLQKLAEAVSITPHHLSQLINERLAQTFSDFVNSYRVEEAKKKLQDPSCKHLSVLGIAIEVGFNSKSSFNSVFKKHTDMTPSEFRSAPGASNGAN